MERFNIKITLKRRNERNRQGNPGIIHHFPPKQDSKLNIIPAYNTKKRTQIPVRPSPGYLRCKRRRPPAQAGQPATRMAQISCCFRRPPVRPRWEPEVQFLGNHAIVCNNNISEPAAGVKTLKRKNERNRQGNPGIIHHFPPKQDSKLNIIPAYNTKKRTQIPVRPSPGYLRCKRRRPPAQAGQPATRMAQISCCFRRPPVRPRWEPEVQFLGNHAIVCNYSIPERGSGVKPQAQIGRSWRGLRACG